MGIINRKYYSQLFKHLKFIRAPALILVITIIIGCNNTNEKETRIFNYNSKSWISKIKHHFVGEITYRATEVPRLYYVMKSANVKNNEEIDSIYYTLRGERVLEFEFEHAANKDLLKSEFTKREYDASVRYMAFDLAKDFLIVTDTNDTILCAGVQLERNYKLAPFKRLLLHFDGVPEQASFELIYKDHLFGGGSLYFDFNNIPTQL